MVIVSALMYPDEGFQEHGTVNPKRMQRKISRRSLSRLLGTTRPWAATTICHLFIALLLFTTNAAGGDQPLLEFGMGVGWISYPDYPGSDERKNLFVPMPYVQYRGRFWRVDRRGIKGLFYTRGRLAINLALDFSFINTSNNPARHDMAELDPAFYIGPSVEYLLLKPKSKHAWLRIRWPVQQAYSLDIKRIAPIGWFSFPHLNFLYRNVYRFNFSVGPMFGSDRYHNYYYGVSEDEQTNERDAFSSAGGYGGWRMAANISQRISNVWFGLFTRYENFAGAAFAASPLLKEKHSLVIGGGISWIFYKSRERAVPVLNSDNNESE